MSRAILICCAILSGLFLSGCKLMNPVRPEVPAAKDFIPPPDMPRELSKTVMPIYTVEPPDIIVIEAIHLVPRSPYILRTGDVISVTAQGTLPDSPIQGAYTIQPGGTINLGLPYGSVKVSGMTVEQAQEAVLAHLTSYLREPVVTASLVEMSGLQQIAGQHLVGPDGTVTLGTYGSVPVVGLTLAQARQAIEEQLSKFLEDPEIAIDVYSYNSKVYYVITEGAGMGDQIARFPITGNETVLDAVANINGMTSISSKKIWIARAVPDCNEMVVLPVDWQMITAGGVAETNYQILPGDRLFISEDKLVAADTYLGKFLAPWERVFGFSLLGVNTVSRYSGKVLINNGGLFGGGGYF